MARVSLTPDVIDGIVAGLRARTGWRGPTDPTEGITVYDGPEFTTTSATHPDGFVVIGWGGEDLEAREGDPDDGITADLTTATMSAAEPKDVDENLQCVAYYGVGSVDVAGTRRAAYALVDGVETWLRTNDRAGVAVLPGGHVHWARVVSTSMRQEIVDGGSRVTIRFAITFKSRT